MKTYTLSNGNTYTCQGEDGERISDNMTFGEWKELYDMDAPIMPIYGNSEEYMDDDCEITNSDFLDIYGFIPVDEFESYERQLEIEKEIKKLKKAKTEINEEEINKEIDKKIEELEDELLFIWM